jgi:hypothetical protein
VHKLAGTWGATGSGATYIDNTHFQGTGVLNVTAGPTSTTTVSGSPNPSSWGASVTFTATITGTNGVPPLTGTATFKDGATILGTGTLSGSPTATATFSTNGLAIGSHTITAIYSGDTNFAGSTSGNFTQIVSPGTFAKLQLLVPGETAAPGTTTGKTGTPTAQLAGTPFTVTVNAVDANWNLVSTNDTVKITSSDASATLPANAALVSGTKSFSLTLHTLGSSTVTASDLTHTGITASTSPPISVGTVAPVLQTMPVVAIHDSELTRALATMPATNGTPLGSGTTGFQWWPTDWQYFVMPESAEEALRSDGTAFEVLGDADISAGRLLASNGQPRCPILISLASEAIQDDEIAQLTNYVASGGFLLVGSSAFTRNTNGTTRGDFAFADALGVHMVVPGLTNWTTNNTLTTQSSYPLVADLPEGQLTWRMPSSSEEISWGISPLHPFLAPHDIWQVQASNAIVIAVGDNYPYLVVKPFGKGYFIYNAAFQPLVGHGGFAPGMYAYVIFRRAIEMAFQYANMPVPKLSPWPYPYDAAFMVRHDLENYQNEIADLLLSAQVEYTNGAKGDYYFCTGTLRAEMSSSYDTNLVIANLREAVSNYGATIGSHNGGLKNPNNPSLVLSNLDYWHWGPDEALDVTPTNYPSGQAYAIASISNSFHDIEGWLSGLTNGLRVWAGCYFNATREGSQSALAQLGVNIAGDEKLTPFPHWTLSTQTNDVPYSFLSEPVSDWFVGGLVAQSLEPWHPPGVHTTNTLRAAVDYFYGLGALINFYSHELSTGNPSDTAPSSGDAYLLLQDYLGYGLNTNLHPRLWSANAVGVYKWWLQRSNAQITAIFTTNGNQSVAAVSITGASNTNTAIELLLPSASFSGLQVFTNGTQASGNGYRVNGQVVKLLVGTSVTNAQIRYIPGPTAVNELYYVTQGSTLTIPAPGVLSNDLAGSSGTLTAILVSGPTDGTLALSTNGEFSYTPATNFAGVDSFSYQASNGLTNSGTAIVTLLVTPVGDLFYDDFTRSGTGDPLAPWQVASGAWAITNGMLEATGALESYSYAYVSNNWTDYWVQGQFQFPVGAFGGGLGGRVNPETGAHYAAWVYPEGSPGGSSVLNLLKFQTWTSWGYNGSSYTPMQQVSLPEVGTNWHTVKLAFLGDQIAVYYDGSLMMSVTDDEPQPYLSGGIGVDMWTDTTNYTMSVDDLIVSPLVVTDSYSVNENITLTVPAPGPLGNDTGVYGTNLMALVVSGPTNGTLNLNSSGGFSYSPATNFAGTDSFVYEANDGQANLGTATVSIAVNPAIIVTANNQSRTYGAANPGLTGSIVGLQNGDNITAVYATAADTNSPVGSYPITIGLLDPGGKLGNYSVTTNNGTLTVNPAPLTVAADNQGQTYGGATPPLTGTIVGLENGDNITAVYATVADATSGVGSYPITIGLLDPAGKLGNYNVTTNNGTLTVNPAPLTVVAQDAVRPYGGSDPVFGGTITGIQNGDNITATYASTDTVSSPVGTYPITPTLVDPSGKLGNYSVSATDGTLTVQPAVLTGTADAKSRLYGSANPPFTATYTGFVNGQDASVVTGTLSGSTPATTNSPVGAYAISVWGQSAPNYSITYVGGTLMVVAAPLLVTADNTNRAYGQTNPPFSATISGWVNGDDTNVLGGELVLTSSADTNSPVGSYPIIPSGLTATNYALSYSNGVLTVTAYALSVTASNQSKTYGAANPLLTGSLLGVQDGDNINAVYATVADTNSPVGDYLITISLLDPDQKLGNYSIATNNGTLTVSPASLTVAADTQTRPYGAVNPPLTATISGFVNGEDTNVLGGALVLSCPAQTNSPVGSYPIIPSGLTSTNYAITFSNGTLSVTAVSLTVVANDASRTYGAANPVFTGTITGIQNGDDITATYATTATDTSPVGTYPIIPTILDPTGMLPNYDVTLTNGTLTVTAPTLPAILSTMCSAGTNIIITWASVSNSMYRVQYKADLASSDWTNLTPDVLATGSTASFTDQLTVDGQRYYRVALVP